jgi:hypothetical protein
VPVPPVVIVIQLASETADHEQPAWVVTVTVPVPPPRPNDAEVGDSVKLQDDISRVRFVLWVMFAATVIFGVNVPRVALAVAVSVRVEVVTEPLNVVGLKVPVTPAGSPVTDNDQV